MTQPPFSGNDFFDQIDSVARNLTGNAFRLKKNDPTAPQKFTEFVAQSEQEFGQQPQQQAQPQSFTDFEQGGFVSPEVAEARLQDPDWVASQTQPTFAGNEGALGPAGMALQALENLGSFGAGQFSLMTGAAPQEFKDALAAERAFINSVPANNPFERFAQSIERDLFAPSKAFSQTRGDYPQIGVTQEFVDKAGNVLSSALPVAGIPLDVLTPDPTDPQQNQFHIGTGELLEVATDPLNFAGPGSFALKGAGKRVVTGAGKKALSAGEEAAAAVGRTGVGNVLDPVPPQTVAGRAAGGAGDVPEFGSKESLEKFAKEQAFRRSGNVADEDIPDSMLRIYNESPGQDGATLSRAEQEELRDFLRNKGTDFNNQEDVGGMIRGTFDRDYVGDAEIYIGTFINNEVPQYVVWNPAKGKFRTHSTMPDARQIRTTRARINNFGFKNVMGTPHESANETLEIFSEDLPLMAPARDSAETATRALGDGDVIETTARTVGDTPTTPATGRAAARGAGVVEPVRVSPKPSQRELDQLEYERSLAKSNTSGNGVVREHSSPLDLTEEFQTYGKLDPGIHVAGDNVYRVGADGVPVRDPSVDASFNWRGPHKGIGNFSINPTTKNVEKIPAEIAPLIQGTKVVDYTGKPLRVFHGTPHEFDEFVANSGTNYGINSIEGIYFDPRRSGAFGQGLDPNIRIVEAYVNLQNPSIGTRNLTREELIAKGHDGVINVDTDGEIWEIIAFDNSQIHQVSTPATGTAAARQVTPQQQAIIDDVGTGALPADDVAVDALDVAPVSDGKAGGSGPPKLRNRPTADADFPPSSRSILDSPAPTIAAKDDPVIKRVAQAIRDTKPATKESLEALSKGRKRQIARAGSAARKAQTFGDVGSSATRAMGGEIPRPEFEPIAQLFTPDEVEALLSRIWGRGSVLEFANSPPGYINFRQINADAAFKKLFNPDSATLPTPYEMELLERVFGPEMIRAVLSKKKLGQKAWDLFLNLWNLPRALLATGDISATARQAAVLGPGNPKDFKNAFKAQLKAFASEEYARASREAIESDLDFARFTTKSGMPVDIGTRQQQRLYIASLGEATDITRREEQFMSRFAGRLPFVRNSERAFVTMLNELRFTVMKRMVAAIEIGGKTATDEQLDAIASFINFATGRGSLGKAEGAAPLLNGIGFSPRLAVSRFQLPLPLLTRSPNVRKKFAKDLVAAAGGLYLFLWLADKHPDIDVEPNPFNSDFGKLRIGKTRFDFGAGTLQTARFIAQITSGKREAIGTKSQSEANRVQIATTFLRSKAHPSLGLGLDVANEEDFLGESFTLDSESFTKLDLRKNPVLRTITMMFIQDIVEAWKESGPLMAAGAAIAAPLGVGVSSFSTVEDSSQELWGLPITEVQPFQQELAKELFARTSERSLGVFDQTDINHYDVFQDIVKQFKSGDINKRTAVNRYFSTNTFYSGLRKGLSAGIFGGDLNEESVFPKAPSAGTDAEKEALQEYYDSSAPFESLSGFDSEEWEKVLKVLERKWKRDGTLEYVFANTNMRPVPAELLKLLPESTMKKIQQSHNARRNILRSLDAQEIEIDRTTLNARPDVYTPKPRQVPVSTPTAEDRRWKLPVYGIPSDK